MKLLLTNDEGTVINSWYISDEDKNRYYPGKRLEQLIELNLPVYDSKEDYEEECKP